MSDILQNNLYSDNLLEASRAKIDWKRLNHKCLMISGATGMIGKYLIDLIMLKNKEDSLDCKIVALGRNREKAKKRLGAYFKDDNFCFFECDINDSIPVLDWHVDYIIHLASSTHPKQYANEPVATITSNIIGLNNLLKCAVANKVDRFIFASSVEIYGENRGDTEKFREEYLGYIDCNTLRAGYPESKRAGEALCQAYRVQYGVDIVIPRLARVFGPTMLLDDSKASSQFILNAVNNEDIVLKSEGKQVYSYLYVADAVIGILLCLFSGRDGEAYNIADDGFDITLKDLADELAKISGSNVIFDLPDEDEKKGFSKATKALLDGNKTRKLGFSVQHDMHKRLMQTINILEQLS